MPCIYKAAKWYYASVKTFVFNSFNSFNYLNSFNYKG